MVTIPLPINPSQISRYGGASYIVAGLNRKSRAKPVFGVPVSSLVTQCQPLAIQFGYFRQWILPQRDPAPKQRYKNCILCYHLSQPYSFIG